MGANGTEAEVSWEEGLYTPQGSSSSLAFLIPAASACVLADDYVPTGGPWRLKRLDFGMRLHAVLFGVMLLSLCDIFLFLFFYCHVLIDSLQRIPFKYKWNVSWSVMGHVGHWGADHLSSFTFAASQGQRSHNNDLVKCVLTVTKWSNQPRRDPV